MAKARERGECAGEMVLCGCRGGVGAKRVMRSVSVIDLQIPVACDILPCCDRVVSSPFPSRNGITHILRNHLHHSVKSNFRSTDPSFIQKLMHEVVRYPNVVQKDGEFVTLKGVFRRPVGVSSGFRPADCHCLVIVVRSDCNFNRQSCKNCFVVTSYPDKCL